MSEAGFFQQNNRSPAGFLVVVGMHAAAIGAVMLIKGPEIIERLPPLQIYPVTPDPPPKEQPRERPKAERLPNQPVIDRVPPIIEPNRPADQPPIDRGGPTVTGGIAGGTGEGIVIEPIPDPPIPTPVRRDAEIDPRFANALQPPYPLSEQRAERSGIVRIRVTIGTDGRVKAVERVSATSDAFYEAAARQAMRGWRFRPATVDGRPVESTKLMTLHFRIEDA